MFFCASDTSLLRHTSTSCYEWVAAVCSGCCARSWVSWRKLHRSPCEHWLVLFSIANRYVFFQLRSIPFDSGRRFLVQLSHAQRQSFVIEVSELYSSSPLFSFFTVENRDLLVNLHVVQFQYGFELIIVTSICTDFPRYHRMEFVTSTKKPSPILYRISEYCRHEGWQRTNQHNPILYHERVSFESSRRSWRRSVFLAEISPLFGLSYPFFCAGNSGWSCLELRQSSRLASRSLQNPSHKLIVRIWNSSIWSTISTSLIHNITSDGKSEQAVT